MDYLKKYVTKLLCNTDLYYHQNMIITYSEMAHTILSTMIMAILYGYGGIYPLLDASYYCIGIASGYIIYTIIKIILRCYLYITLNTYHIKTIGIILVSTIIVGMFSYYHVTYTINDYVGNGPFYINQEGDYAVLVDTPVEMTIIDGIVYKKFTASLLGMSPYKNTAKGLHIRANGNLRITIEEAHKPIQMGQLLIIKGTPKPLYVTEERGTIDMRSRAIRNDEKGKLFGGTYRLMTEDEIRAYHISKGTLYYQRILVIIGAIRQYIEDTMSSHLSEHTRWLGISLVVGGHYGELGDDVIRAFGYTGIIHILSISGSHIALLFSLVYSLCRLCHIKKRYAMIGGILVSLLYCSIVGFSAPVVRSTIMGICMAMAYLLGRLYAAKQGLAMTAIVFLLYDPLLILDVSFQLSFGATYGLLLFGMPLYRWITILPPLVKAPLVLSISAQLIMIPYQLYYFHYISIASLIAALLVTPILDITIVFLFIGTLMNSLVSFTFIWSLMDILLQLALAVNTYIAHNELLIIWIGILPLSLGLLYIVLLNGLYVSLVSFKQSYRWCIYALCITLLCTLGIAKNGILYKKDTIAHIVPLKQANVLVLIKPYGHTASVYIDAPDGVPVKASEYRIVNALHSYGIHPKSITLEHFQSNGKNRILYGNDIGTVMVYNRQSEEKKLQLKDTKRSLIITSQSFIAHHISHAMDNQSDIRTKAFHGNNILRESSRNPLIVLTMPRGAMRDVDPDNGNIALWGYRYIPDMIL